MAAKISALKVEEKQAKKYFSRDFFLKKNVTCTSFGEGVADAR